MGVATTFINKQFPSYVNDQVMCAEDATDLADNNQLLWQMYIAGHNLQPGNAADGIHWSQNRLDGQGIAQPQPAVLSEEGTVSYSGTQGAGGAWVLEDGINAAVSNEGVDAAGKGIIASTGQFLAATTTQYHFTAGAFPNSLNSLDDPTSAVWRVMVTVRTGTPTFNAHFYAYTTPVNAAVAWVLASNGCRFAFTAQ